ncbi:MAG: 5'-3' exonuclease H3TH domain-containing protein [Microgenomates group bacterium]
MMQQHERFVLFDGHALIYRAYHAFPPLTDPSGMMVNAVFGFSKILLTTIRDLAPQHLAVAFDHKSKTKRSETYKEYKAQRPEMPDDLKPQIELIKEVVQVLNIPQFIEPGFEADDIIGTISTQLSDESKAVETGKKGQQFLTSIVTGDKDLFQLVDEYTHVLVPARDKNQQGLIEYDQAGVERKMSVRANQIIDLKALMGDQSDNIPGVKGVGAKTAVALLKQYQTLDALYEAVSIVDGQGQSPDHPLLKGAVLKKLIADKKMAYLSQELVTIDRSVTVPFDIEKCILSSYDKSKAVNLFTALNFKSVLPLLPKDSFELAVQNALF